MIRLLNISHTSARHTTSQGVIMGGISSVSSEAKEKSKYIQSRVDEGTAHLPLLLVGDEFVLYENYFQDKETLKKNQKNPLLKTDLRVVGKKCINNCGVAQGSVIKSIRNELFKRLRQLITSPKYEPICKIHESKFVNAPETTIDVGTYELAVTWDGKTTKGCRAGNNRTQVHLLFGGLQKYFAGYVLYHD